MIKELIARFALWLIGSEDDKKPEPRYVRQIRQRQQEKADRVTKSAVAVSMGHGRPMMDGAIALHRERRRKFLEEHPEFEPKSGTATVRAATVELKPGELFPGTRAR